MQRTTKHFQINALALAIAMSTISAHAETDQQTSEYGTLPTIKVKAGSGEENEKSYIAGKQKQRCHWVYPFVRFHNLFLSLLNSVYKTSNCQLWLRSPKMLQGKCQPL